MTASDSRSGAEASRRVAVVIAANDARDTARASLARFLEEAGGRGEVVLVDASRDGTADLAAHEFSGLRILREPTGTLAPELWKIGLRATDAPLVAFSTAAMVPSPGWLDALIARLDESGATAVGGPIVPARSLYLTDRAIYLLRYVAYLQPISRSSRPEPPGDNALYRRAALVDMDAILDRGFWEHEVHRVLRARGEVLAMANSAVVVFHGGLRMKSALGQRLRHATIHGTARGGRMGVTERLLRTAAAPLVPAVLLHRIARGLRERGEDLGPWLPALPRLSLLLAAWAFGEARGTSLPGGGSSPCPTRNSGRS